MVTFLPSLPENAIRESVINSHFFLSGFCRDDERACCLLGKVLSQIQAPLLCDIQLIPHWPGVLYLHRSSAVCPLEVSARCHLHHPSQDVLSHLKPVCACLKFTA